MEDKKLMKTPKYEKQHLHVSIFKAYFSYISKNYPQISIPNLLQEFEGLDQKYFSQKDSWVSVVFDEKFFKKLEGLIAEKNFHHNVGRSSFAKENLGIVYYLIKYIFTTEEIYTHIWKFVNHFNKVISFKLVKKEPGYAKVRLEAEVSGLDPQEREALIYCLPFIAQNSAGYYSAITLAKRGFPESKVSSTRLSKEAFEFEIQYPMEGRFSFVKSLLSVFVGSMISLVLMVFGFAPNLSVAAGLCSVFLVLFFQLLLRNKVLVKVAREGEDMLSRLDSQYHDLLEAKIKLQRRLAEAAAINELTNSLIQTSSEDEILSSAAKNLTSILEFDRVLIMIADEQNKCLNVRALSTPDGKAGLDFTNFVLPTEIESSDPTKVTNIFRYGQPILIEDVEAHLKSLTNESQNLLKISGSKSFIGVPIKSAQKSHGVLLVDSLFSGRKLTEADQSVLMLAGKQLAIALEKQHAQNEVVEAYIALGDQAKSYSRFVPFEVIRLLGFKSVQDVDIKTGKELYMTIVFCDIRGFTTMAEHMSPADSLAFLNSYFSDLAPVFEAHGGIIDKFLGDGIMALFMDPNQAFKAAAEFQEKLTNYNLMHRAGGKRDFIRTGMGIHFGKVLLGAVGYQDRLSISVVSDAVNLTSRLDGLTKRFGVEIVCSEEAFIRSDNKQDFRLIARLSVEGRNTQTNIYEYFGQLSEAIKLERRRNSTLIEKKLNDMNNFHLNLQDNESLKSDPVICHYFDETKQSTPAIAS